MPYAKVTVGEETYIGDVSDIERFGARYICVTRSGAETLIPPSKEPTIEYLMPHATSLAVTNRTPLLMIQAAASSVCGVSIEEVLAKNKFRHVVRCRWLGMSYAKKEGYSLIEIGNAYGRDHGTVSHALQADKPDGFEGQLDEMRAALTASNKPTTPPLSTEEPSE